MRTNNLLLYLFTIISVALISACKTDDQSRIQATWTSKDPIAIPHNIRFNQKKLENLAPNNSFETGKIYYEKSDVKSFDITGWKKTGDNIIWVNTDMENFTNDEAFDGIHSIKIQKTSANEVDEPGDGIMSDFIKVIPGNYDFTLNLKFENIKPNQSRIGTKMYDAINIRLICFDKNKIQISSTEYNPFTGSNIDNSFKAFSLSHFRSIKKTDWMEINGKTGNFPFDGDLIDQARYVKIFIGLKATGTLWVDNVNFSYTNQNFTQLERLSSYFDSSYSVLDFILPEPKYLIENEPVLYYSKELNALPKIYVANMQSELQIASAEKVRAYIANLISDSSSKIDLHDIRIQELDEDNQSDTSCFKIIIGNSKNEIINNDTLNWKQNAYFIGSKNMHPNRVAIIGNTDSDLNMAINTFFQMFDNETNIYYSANIYDYPDIRSRNYLIHSFLGSSDDLKQKMATLSLYKFSYPYFQLYDDNNSYYPQFKIGDEFNSSGKFIDANISDVEILGSIKGKKILIEENDSANIALENISKINNTVNYEYMPVYSNLEIIDQEDIQSAIFFNSIENQYKTNLDIVWTGTDAVSFKVDDADFCRIKKITNRTPVFFDNTLSTSDIQSSTEYIKDYYAGKLRTASIFKPYESNLTNNVFNDDNSKVILNLDSFTEINLIRMLTAANYYWNTNTYNPDKTLWLVLNNLYGKENTKYLLYFNDAYWGLTEICRKMKLDGSHFKTLRMAKNFKADLDKYWNLINVNLDNQNLINELDQLKQIIDKEYEEIVTEIK